LVCLQSDFVFITDKNKMTERDDAMTVNSIDDERKTKKLGNCQWKRPGLNQQ